MGTATVGGLEAKRIAVLEARGRNFIDAETQFDGRLVHTVNLRQAHLSLIPQASCRA